MLRSEVLKLYRSMLRVVRRIPDKSQQKELVEWIRHDFTANKHLEDEVRFRFCLPYPVDR